MTQLEPKRDWRKAISVFTADDGPREFFADALKLREADRAKVRRSTKPNGKS